MKDKDQQLLWEAYTDRSGSLGDDPTVPSPAADFVVAVSEMIAAYNERAMSFDTTELLDNVAAETNVDDSHLGEIAQIFEDDFRDPDAGWQHLEVEAIREWLRTQ
jgi:hypothetical protein|tara:strand:- start:66 stop:380 length:315 start_codon:yes stop_codon:yes gene_type:complete